MSPETETRDAAAYWTTGEGAAVLAAASAAAAGAGDVAGAVLRVKRRLAHLPPDVLAEAVSIVVARPKAAARFGEWAREGFFTSVTLAQTSHPDVAAYRARRFAGCRHVLDLCAGAGTDAAALASVVPRVTSVESCPRTAGYASRNLALRGHAPPAVRVVTADAARYDVPDADGVWADPSRRDAAGRRLRDPAAWSPPLGVLLARRGGGRRLGIKVSPAYRPRTGELPAGVVREWIGHAGECKDQVFWSGSDVADGTVTVVGPGGAPAGSWRPPAGAETPAAETLAADPGSGAPAYLLDPHPALVASGHARAYFAALGAAPFDVSCSYFAADVAPPKAPFHEAFEVEEVLHYSTRGVSEALAAAGWGPGTEIKKRNFPEEPDMVRRRLVFPDSGDAGVIVLTRRGAVPSAVLCRRVR